MSGSKTEKNPTLILYKNCTELRQEFLSLKTSRDIAKLLEVSYDRLVFHLYRNPGNKKYIEFLIPKKSGYPRTITAPATALKILQRKLSQVLYSVYEPKDSVHGFVCGRNVVTNAKQHLRKRFVLNLDLKDFFGSIHFGRVRGIFIAPPFNLSKEVATVLAQICCHENKLPQGAPTSPVVSNIVCARFDRQLQSLAKEFKCTYTRYADDITFSTTLPKFPKELAYISFEGEISKIIVGEKLISIIHDNDFKINEQKIKLRTRKNHQGVTGLTVNEFPNVKREYIRKISCMLNIWNNYGIKSAQEKYTEKYSKEIEEFNQKGIYLKKTPLFKESLRGKINFLGMVRGKNDPIFLKYLDWYRTLSKRDCSTNPISEIDELPLVSE